MTVDELLKKFIEIQVWKKGGVRAVHKPLTILLFLRYVKKGYRLVKYNDVENELINLLMKYGPERKTYRPQYSFWRLRNDGVWKIPKENELNENIEGDVSVKELREKKIEAGFADEIFHLLKTDNITYRNLVQLILDENFPYSLHNELLEDIGLDLRYSIESLRQKRDPQFRNKILSTYDFKCAICGYDLRFYDKSLALEAAHIKWHKAGGPDIEQNGIALCNLHHKLFDFGAIAIDSDRRLIISGKLQGSYDNLNPLLSMHNDLINPPSVENHTPKQEFINWHLREVFKKRDKN